ncbi:MAG TPA: DUF6390 family protein [Candidatus Woesebacteria bacterium]|nr:DUF6390 family protein [Candidatus Woesebacteria bacterium]
MDTRALALASRFAYSPNARGYCGRSSAQKAFIHCIKNGECDGVVAELSHFIVLHPYLLTIAQAVGASPFDYEVIEAYWLGNNLLNKITSADYELLLNAFETQGVAPWLIAQLRTRWPSHFIPTHLFQVLHVGVGQASGSVPFDIHSINECAVRWAQVEKITSTGDVSVRSARIMQKGGAYILKEDYEEKLKRDACALTTPVAGSWVALHWGHIVKILRDEELANLTLWTKQTLMYVPVFSSPHTQVQSPKQ